MFTGLVEETGTIVSKISQGEASKIQIKASKILSDIKPDNSVAVNGVCLTVVKVMSDGFIAEAVEETMKKTTLSSLKTGDSVNLERALQLSSRLGGHLMLGHVDTIGKIIEIRKQTLGNLFKFTFDKKFSKYLVRTGSICIDGISLTLAENDESTFMTSIIPHTLENTIIRHYRIGTEVNLEFDIIGKYVEKMVKGTEKFDDKIKEFLMS
jgi:riboflavin synthase